MANDDNLIIRAGLSAVVILGSGLTSIGTAGISGIAGVAGLFAIWGIDWDSLGQ